MRDEFINPRWYLSPAGSSRIARWSNGVVRNVADLYSPGIFGKWEEPRCKCGSKRGGEHVRELCRNCGSFCTETPTMPQWSYVGRIVLAAEIEHPLRLDDCYCFDAGGAYMQDVPIPPLGFRVNRDGSPNPLGTKYERLVAVNSQFVDPAVAQDPLKENPVRSALIEQMRSIIGTPQQAAGEPCSNLMGLLAQSIFKMDGHTDILLKSCACSLFLDGKI